MLRMRARRPVYCFMTLAEAIYVGAAGWSYDMLSHPETLIFELS